MYYRVVDYGQPAQLRDMLSEQFGLYSNPGGGVYLHYPNAIVGTHSTRLYFTYSFLTVAGVSRIALPHGCGSSS